jgi:uncharacterized membrane protein
MRAYREASLDRRNIERTMLIVIALLLGFATGLRTFIGPAAYFLHRGGVAGIVLAVFAVLEMIVDALPQAPSRTHAVGLGGRIISGGVVGWFVAGIPGAIAGIAGAVAGTYAGHAARARAITAIGAIPAALAEDAVAIALAFFTAAHA